VLGGITELRYGPPTGLYGMIGLVGAMIRVEVGVDLGPRGPEQE